MEAGRVHHYARPAPRRLSTIGWGGVAPPEQVPRLDGFPTMMIMMMLPMIVGAMATLVNSWTGFIEAAFMDMTLTLEDFDYGFGPADCGAWEECGNATFESYQRARDLAIPLFLMALIVVGIKDMLKSGLGDVSLGAVDTKTLPEMLKYSALVFAFLFMFPPVWDVAAGTMNNVGLWILNPHYDIAGRGEYVHGVEGRGEMCVGQITHDDLVELAPYVRDWDAWAVYRDGAEGPMLDGEPALYGRANNYIISEGEVLTRECLHDKNSASCPAGWDPGAAAVGYEIGDVLCNPDFLVKYVFRQALGVVETEAVNPEQVLGAVTGTGGDDILVAILTQFLKSSVTLQVIMVVFMVGVMVDVVTSFALAILPVVFFYRFLPMSDKVRLGDYSGAAFALLAMPLIASLVVVAGAGAVAAMAADADSRDFGSFFVWLAALSVVLLVIAIPSTMVPLIASAQQQATAAIQTGVMTAQFAGTAVAAGAGGAMRGRREHGEFRRLAGMKPSAMSHAQKTRMAELKAAGHDKMSTARAAMQGGTAGLRGQMYDEKGKPTQAFRNVAMPGTGDFTAKSVQGLGGFKAEDATKDVAGLSDSMGTAAVEATRAGAREMSHKPTKEELMKTAERDKAGADKEVKEADGRLKAARKDARSTEGYGEHAGTLLKEEKMVAGEELNRKTAEMKRQKSEAGLEAADAKMEDLSERRTALEREMGQAGAERRAEIEREISGIDKEAAKTGATVTKLKDDVAGFEAEVARSGESLRRHTGRVEAEMARLAGLASSGAIGGAAGAAILEEQAAYAAQKEAVAHQKEAAANLEGMQREMRQEQYEQHTDAVKKRWWKRAKPKPSGGSGSRHPFGRSGSGGSLPYDGPPDDGQPSKPPPPTPPPAAAANAVLRSVTQGGPPGGDGGPGDGPEDGDKDGPPGEEDGGGRDDKGDDMEDPPAPKPKKPPGPGAVSGVILQQI